MTKLIKRISIVISIFLIIWVIVGFIDYWKVCHSFEKPIFSIPVSTVDDGGSGLYKGLGYSFEIKGNFMPDDMLPGVTKYKYNILNKTIKSNIRD